MIGTQFIIEFSNPGANLESKIILKIVSEADFSHASAESLTVRITFAFGFISASSKTNPQDGLSQQAEYSSRRSFRPALTSLSAIPSLWILFHWSKSPFLITSDM